MQVIHKLKQLKAHHGSTNTAHAFGHKPHMGITPHHILSLLLLLGCSSLILMGAVYGNKTASSDNVQAISDGGIATLATTVSPSLELTMNNSVTLNIEPTAEGQFGRIPLSVFVNTNSTSGYTLTMMSNGGGDGNGALKRDRMVLGENYYIRALSENKSCTDETDTTCDNFPSGYWGYRVDGNTNDPYKPITPYVNNATEIKKTESSTGSTSDETVVYFGSKLDNTTPTGDYSGVSLTFAVTTNIFQWSINYHAGNSSVSAEDVKGLPAVPQSGTIDWDDEDGEKKAALEAAPTRTGYAFLGWCSVEPTTTTSSDSNGTVDVCQDGDQYAAGQEVTIRINGPSVLDFYAMWTSAKVSVTFNLNTGVKSLTVKGYFGENMQLQEQVITTSTQTMQLAASSTYTLTSEYDTGYRAPTGDAYAKSGSVTLNNNTLITGMNNGATVTALSKIKDDLSLTITWSPENGVKSVKVYENAISGNSVDTITKSGDSTGNHLTFGYNYYMVPDFEDNYVIASWDKGASLLGGEVVGELHTSADVLCGTIQTAWYNIGDGENIAELAAQQVETIAANATMQSLAGKRSRLIQAMTVGQPYTVTDTRGGSTKSYHIAKLADCNIWMLDNLNLGGASPITLTSSDTNLEPETQTTDGTTKLGQFTLPALSTTVPANDNSNAKLYRPTGTAKSYNISTNTWVDITGSDAEARKGILYNYAAASAGTVSDSISGSTGAGAAGDICPKGWHLPSANSATSDFGKLTIAYGGNTNGTGSFASSTQAYKKFNDAFNTTRSGYFSGGSLNNVGSYGYFWASTPDGTPSRYYLGVYDSPVYPANSNRRYYGLSVRCVLK